MCNTILIGLVLILTSPLFALPWKASDGNVSAMFDASMTMNNPTVNITINGEKQTMLWSDFRKIQKLANYLTPQTQLTQVDILITLDTPTKSIQATTSK